MTPLSSPLTPLHASSLTPHNRLASIASDAAFIRSAALSIQRPLVANERCGAWYVGDGAQASSAYFKSTDGHERAWKFSARRPPRRPLNHNPNLSLLPIFVSDLAALCLDLGEYKLSKPLRPLWIGPDSPLPGPGPIFEDYTPVICCSASRVEAEGERTAGYVQGAADDAENWALGLTPSIFWRNVDALLAASDAHLPSLIATLITESRTTTSKASKQPRQLTPSLSVTALPLPPPTPETCQIALTATPTPPQTWIQSRNRMDVGLGRHKKASRNLRLALPDVCGFVARFVAAGGGRVMVGCESGRDVCVGAALALLCRVVDEGGCLRVMDEGRPLTKAVVKARLAAIMAAFPEANPSRQTLQSVNSFLLDWRA
ncbi:hypothetical protein CDD80_6209 [Ophiocordyceps camponoti-rufipedis]|uniref:Initiator tRNA phosphoribosyl transferase n=1 Tax=Ophiocordyceps camponoti-rufipedis TaxID=2004952 RepID=A0A2C5YS41_9HYPO|nr:hypothetical protein CDD80_6209 [Ophiocordyceps camponoti-rufipedis]